ncbi:MAG TPA: DUF2079 domain-containing protein [Candidatus Cybelea sp.]|nr:DUF2079 domain-containing protein [Candidatus Cybelea sp.]
MRDRFLWIGCIVYAVLLTWLGAIKYDVHRNLVDFGIFAQTAASAFGCFCNPIEGSHWAFHFSPVLYAVGFAVTLVRSPLTLVALQAIAGALVAPPVYALVRRAREDVRAARLAAVVAWLYPPLAGLIFGDFHENGFAPAAVVWTLYAFESGSLAGTIAGAIATLSIKEDQAVFLAIAGALGAWRFRGSKRGIVAGTIAAASVLTFVAYFAVIQPRAAAAQALPWQPLRFYQWSGVDARALLGTIPARLGFVLLAFGPLLFLPFRSPAMWLAAAPLAEVLVSRMSTTYTMGSHYAGAWIGYVLFAFALALGRVGPVRLRGVLLACIALCVVEFAVADPLHPRLNLRPVAARDAELDTFLQTLPHGVSLATQEEAYTHLASREPLARLLPELTSQETRACFVLLDFDFPESARLQEYGAGFARLLADRRYVPIARVQGIALYRRLGRCT